MEEKKIKIIDENMYLYSNYLALQQQLQLKDKQLRELNQARDEICASGQEDYIGIIRNKNIELQLKDKMIKNISKKNENLTKSLIILNEFINGLNKSFIEAQQALVELEGK